MLDLTTHAIDISSTEQDQSLLTDFLKSCPIYRALKVNPMEFIHILLNSRSGVAQHYYS